MVQNPIYSLTALFDSPDEIMHAAEKTSKAGYTKYDVHTPYPVHGMDHAMRLNTSKIGYFAFAFGLLGALSAVIFISWVTISDYPLVIGGKPFWSWPAFVPVSFEVTVLLASVLSTLAMIVFYFKFPNNAHPLHDTHYIKQVSSDKFGLSIQAEDPKFDEKRVKEFLKSVGGKEITPIFFELEELNHGKNLFDLKFIAVLMVVALTVSAATYFTLNKLMFMQPFNWMMVQNKLKSQQSNEFFKDGIGMRPPVEGTVARGFMPYAFKGRPVDAGKYLVDPVATDKRSSGTGQVEVSYILQSLSRQLCARRQPFAGAIPQSTDAAFWTKYALGPTAEFIMSLQKDRMQCRATLRKFLRRIAGRSSIIFVFSSGHRM